MVSCIASYWRSSREINPEYIYRDIIYELACVGDLPLPAEPSPPPSHKRGRDSYSPTSSGSSAPSPPASNSIASAPRSDEPRLLAGSRRVSSTEHQASQFQSQSSFAPSNAGPSTSTLSHFTLPMHSTELGSLPLHATFGDDSSLPPGNNAWLAADHMQPGPAHIHPYPQATAPPDNLFSETTEMDAYSSMMYDQVMSNLHGSMAPVSQYSSSQRMPLPTENLGHLLTTLGSDGVMFSDDGGAMPMWTSTPTGFE